MKKYEVDVFSVDLNMGLGRTKTIEASDVPELIRMCGITFPDNGTASQVSISSRRTKIFVTDTSGFKFVLDVMAEA